MKKQVKADTASIRDQEQYMAVACHSDPLDDAVTPLCNACGIALCWDISRTEYLEAKRFWDDWSCQDCHGSRPSAYGWKMLNGHEALPPAVEAVIIAFEDANRQHLGADGAQGRSGKTSAAFCAALAADGLVGEVVEVACVNGIAHEAVVIGAFTIDWTAGQHDSNAPVPLVYRSAHGWPVEPAEEPTTEQAPLDRIAEMTEEAFEQFLSRIVARRKAA